MEGQTPPGAQKALREESSRVCAPSGSPPAPNAERGRIHGPRAEPNTEKQRVINITSRRRLIRLQRKTLHAEREIDGDRRAGKAGPGRPCPRLPPDPAPRPLRVPSARVAAGRRPVSA